MSEMVFIPVERLVPHPDNPRKDLGDLTELAVSIKENGILQNLTVVPEFEDRFTVIIGHRRLAAAKLAGLTELPCVIVEMTPKEQVQTMLLENMQRSDLTVYEQAQGFQMMLDLGSTVEEIAEKSGFSQATVRRRVKMMELDQPTLKEVSGRQLSLGDFDTLAKIENINDRNAALKSIGTREFDAEVAKAMNKQAIREKKPVVKAWIKEVGAKEISRSDSWGNKYEGYGGGYAQYIYIAKWGEPGNKPPKISAKKPAYYTMDDDSIRIFQKTEKKKPEKKPPEVLAKEKAIREAWKSLDCSQSEAYTLRKQFVGKLNVTSKNKIDVLRGVFYAAAYNAVEYNSPDRGALFQALMIDENVYGHKREMQLAAGLGAFNNNIDLVRAAYSLFGDDEKVGCTKSTYHTEFPEYQLGIKLNLIYDWLTSLGYEMSTEEMQLLNGEHEAYHAGEAYDAAK